VPGGLEPWSLVPGSQGHIPLVPGTCTPGAWHLSAWSLGWRGPECGPGSRWWPLVGAGVLLAGACWGQDKGPRLWAGAGAGGLFAGRGLFTGSGWWFACWRLTLARWEWVVVPWGYIRVLVFREFWGLVRPRD